MNSKPLVFFSQSCRSHHRLNSVKMKAVNKQDQLWESHFCITFITLCVISVQHVTLQPATSQPKLQWHITFMKNLNGEHRGDTYCFTKGNHRTVNHCIFIHWGSRLWINTHDDYSSQSMSTDSYTHVDWWLTAASAGLMDVIWFSQGIWIKHKHRFR